MTHVIALASHDWVWLIWGAFRLDWWLLHRWWFLAAGMSYDLIKYGVLPTVRGLIWRHRLVLPNGLPEYKDL